MKPTFFYFERLKTWDIIAAVCYVVISTVLYSLYKNSTVETQLSIISRYACTTEIILFLLFYKSLRNFSVYLIWLAFALIQFVLYFFIRLSQSAHMPGHLAYGFRNVIFFVLLYQGLRYFSIKVQKREFVAPVKGSSKDEFDNIELSNVDYIIFFVYFGCVLLLNYL
jgi:hypothetical protein